MNKHDSMLEAEVACALLGKKVVTEKLWPNIRSCASCCAVRLHRWPWSKHTEQ